MTYDACVVIAMSGSIGWTANCLSAVTAALAVLEVVYSWEVALQVVEPQLLQSVEVPP